MVVTPDLSHAVATVGARFRGNVDVVIRRVFATESVRRYRAAIRAAEVPAVVLVASDRVAALVHQPMMRGTQEHRIREARLAALRPVPHVVGIDEAGVGAARERAAAVA